MTVLEIAVQDPAGARIAFEAGADRIELCQALSVGGLTPSAGTVDHVLTTTADPARIGVLVRPRGGGFVYDAEETAIATTDIRHFAAAGISRFVVGALTEQGEVDLDAIWRWKSAAPGAHFVFHRAIDTIPDPRHVIDKLIELGVESILTSGGARRSIDAVVPLAALVHHAAGRLEIVAGGGVLVSDIPTLVMTGVDAIHLSARATAAAGSAGPGGGNDNYDVTDGAIVAAAGTSLRSRGAFVAPSIASAHQS